MITLPVLSIRLKLPVCSFFFFFNDTATTEIYTLSLHDALPIWREEVDREHERTLVVELVNSRVVRRRKPDEEVLRSEEHTSELQSRPHLVCRLLLEKKKKHNKSSALASAHSIA